jgi:RNA polymerase sigma-70 factor (ECF subfamily)
LLPCAISLDRESVPPQFVREDELVSLFQRLRSPLLRYLLTFGIAVHDGEEIVQEAFLALFKHLKANKSDANLPGWVFRVCHNLALKHVDRVRRRLAVINVEFDWLSQHADSALDPEQQLAETQRHEKLQAVLRALPAQDRYCICLRAEGLRYREIAQILDISLGAVSISLARSVARFERADQE